MAPGKYGNVVPLREYPVYNGVKSIHYYPNANNASETVNEIVTTIKTIINSIANDSLSNPAAGGTENTGSEASDNAPNPGIAEMMNITLTNIADAASDPNPGISDLVGNTIPNIGEAINNNSIINPNVIGSENGNNMFNTSFELVTTELNDWSTPMMHHGEEDNYDGLIFIILGLVLGVLVIAVITLGVLYSHYRKRGFQEITGSNTDKCDPPSMQQLEQACSDDALLNK